MPPGPHLALDVQAIATPACRPRVSGLFHTIVSVLVRLDIAHWGMMGELAGAHLGGSEQTKTIALAHTGEPSTRHDEPLTLSEVSLQDLPNGPAVECETHSTTRLALDGLPQRQLAGTTGRFDLCTEIP